MSEKIKNSFYKLEKYCKEQSFKGYDPFDGLNSILFQAIPYLRKNRFARLAWIQFFKRSPLNLRTVAGIKRDYNAKAMGLFLSGYCNLYRKRQDSEYLNMIHFFISKLDQLVNKNYSGSSWGYNFDWQAKAFFQPKNTPTVVATSFIGNALLDAYEITGEDRLISIVRSACDFINKDLYRTYDENKNFAFSY